MPYPYEDRMDQAMLDQLIPLETIEAEIRHALMMRDQARATQINFSGIAVTGLPIQSGALATMAAIERYWTIRALVCQELLWRVLGGFQATDEWIRAHGFDLPHVLYVVPGH